MLKHEGKVNINKGLKLEPLVWSVGLSRACRDIVIDNGPKDLRSHEGILSGSAMNRADHYLGNYDNLREILIFGKIPRAGKPEEYNKLAEELYNSFLDIKLDYDKQTALISSELTHVGISCGCQKT